MQVSLYLHLSPFIKGEKMQAETQSTSAENDLFINILVMRSEIACIKSNANFI